MFAWLGKKIEVNLMESPPGTQSPALKIRKVSLHPWPLHPGHSRKVRRHLEIQNVSVLSVTGL